MAQEINLFQNKKKLSCICREVVYPNIAMNTIYTIESLTPEQCKKC